MPRYYPIRFWADQRAQRRAIDRLLDLRRQLREEVGQHKTSDSLLLATWNIRDFDSNKFKHGPRLDESFHYVAEIIAAFDLVAVQEVNRDLSALLKVMQLLGEGWDFMVTDTTEGSSGNQERIAFVFDTRRVRFRNVAGEIVLPKGRRIPVRRREEGAGGEAVEVIDEDELQFARTPFVVAFRAGWFKFNLCAVHIYFGQSSGALLERRIDEIRELAEFFKRRQEVEGEDYILLGDFNIVAPDDRTMAALLDAGFKIPEPLTRQGSNLKGDKHYDQIALRVQEKRLQIGAAGVLDFTRSVLRDTDQDFAAYFDLMPAGKRDFHDQGRRKGQPRTVEEQRAYYLDEWRTWQMSDHRPMWVQLKVDFSDDYLASLRPEREPLADMREREQKVGSGPS